MKKIILSISGKLAAITFCNFNTDGQCNDLVLAKSCLMEFTPINLKPKTVRLDMVL